MNTLTRTMIIFLTMTAIYAPSASAIDRQHGDVFPKQLYGTWQSGRSPCLPQVITDSDRWLHITKYAIHSNEETIKPTLVSQISSRPWTWRVVGLSSIAPLEIQGEAEIFVLSSDSLIMTDGKNVHQYSRCRRG